MTHPQDTTPANPAQVTDAMVEDATTEFLSHKGERPWRVTRRGAELWEDYAPAMRAALTAAIGAGGQAVAVKALEWTGRNKDGTIHIAHVVPMEYWAWELAGFGYWSWGTLSGREVHGGIEAAKAAAQADYERRILSALSQPHPADERVVEDEHLAFAMWFYNETGFQVTRDGETYRGQAHDIWQGWEARAALAQEGR